MKQKQMPWCDERGFPLPDDALKEVSKLWDLETWESYLKSFESRKGHGQLLQTEVYDALAEGLEESIFDSSMPAAPEELQIEVQKALSQITEKQQEVVKKVFWEGKSQTRIGRELKISQQAVFKLKTKALKKLKELLQGVVDSPLVRGVKNTNHEKATSTSLFKNKPNFFNNPQRSLA